MRKTIAATDICLLLTALKDITDVLSLFEPKESAVLKQCSNYQTQNGHTSNPCDWKEILSKSKKNRPSCSLQVQQRWSTGLIFHLVLFLKSEQPQRCQYKDINSWVGDSLTVKPRPLWHHWFNYFLYCKSLDFKTAWTWGSSCFLSFGNS